MYVHQSYITHEAKTELKGEIGKSTIKLTTSTPLSTIHVVV
jgi:hypothetical protein